MWPRVTKLLLLKNPKPFCHSISNPRLKPYTTSLQFPSPKTSKSNFFASMATTAAVARNLLKNSKSLPQILRGQILGRSTVTANLNNIAKDHQIVQSLFVSNQKIHAQIPIFDFTEMGSLLGSSGGLSQVEKGIGHGMRGVVIEARGTKVVKDEDEYEDEDEDEDEDEFDDEFVDEFDEDYDDDEDDDDDDGEVVDGKY